MNCTKIIEDRCNNLLMQYKKEDKSELDVLKIALKKVQDNIKEYPLVAVFHEMEKCLQERIKNL